jgi:uncharacterized membrane protein
MRSKLVTTLASLTLIATLANAQPYRYQMTIISPFAGATRVNLEDVNSDGMAVGYLSGGGQRARGFTWTEAGGISFLPSPANPASDVRPKGISEVGLIAATANTILGDGMLYTRAHTYDLKTGSWTMIHPWAGCTSVMQAMSPSGDYCGEVQHRDNNGDCGSQFDTGEAFSGADGDASTLGRLSSFPSWAHAINNLGQACGEGYTNAQGNVRGYFKAPGSAILTLPGLGGGWAFAYGLNDNGLIVGYASRPGDDDWVAVSWSRVAGVWTIKDMNPETISSIAWDVNNAGQIVGTRWDGVSAQADAVLWVGNQVWNLNDLVDNPTGRLVEAKVISETGWIVGSIAINGATRGFILKPVDQDSDGDGLLDSWELNGIPYEDSDGVTQHFMLPDADPMHKDLYVEVDLMSTMSFPDEAIERVVFAFETSPVTNPDGVDGVTLHVLRDETDLSHLSVWQTDGCWPLDFDTWRSGNFGTIDEFIDDNAAALLEAKAKAYRYCIVADAAGPEPVGGCGETPGDSFVVFVGNPAYGEEAKAAVFMHELGHNLGLEHGGGDSINGKPNYPSVMNYVLSYRYDWNSAFWRLDFSREGGDTFAALDESSLNENIGLGTAAGFYSSFKMPFGVNVDPGGGGIQRATVYAALDGSPTDYGDIIGDGFQDGNFDTGIAQDLNYAVDGPSGIPSVESAGQTLRPYNDWANVALPLASTLGSTAPGASFPTDELTTDAREWINDNFPPPDSCAADLTGDGALDFFDLQAFLNFYAAGDLTADFVPDGVLDFFDVQAFLNLYAAGCP